MIKAFWSHFKHFERLLAENFICSSLPARLIEVSSKPSKVNLQPATRLWKFSQQTLLTSLGVVRGRNSPSQWVGRGKRLLTNNTCQLLHIKSPRTPWIVFSPATLSFHGHIISSTSPSHQKLAWRTDILWNRSLGCPWVSVQLTWRNYSFIKTKNGLVCWLWMYPPKTTTFNSELHGYVTCQSHVREPTSR